MKKLSFLFSIKHLVVGTRLTMAIAFAFSLGITRLYGMFKEKQPPHTNLVFNASPSESSSDSSYSLQRGYKLSKNVYGAYNKAIKDDDVLRFEKIIQSDLPLLATNNYNLPVVQKGQDAASMLPLSHAIKLQAHDIILHLGARGANISQVDLGTKKTPIEFLCYSSTTRKPETSLSILRYLIRKGASTESIQSGLRVAYEQNNDLAFEILLAGDLDSDNISIEKNEIFVPEEHLEKKIAMDNMLKKRNALASLARTRLESAITPLDNIAQQIKISEQVISTSTIAELRRTVFPNCEPPANPLPPYKPGTLLKAPSPFERWQRFARAPLALRSALKHRGTISDFISIPQHCYL